MKPYIGMPVQYRCRPGQVRAGQQDLAALITKLWPDGAASLVVFVPDTPDTLQLPKVLALSQEVTGHCWHVPARGDDAARLGEIETQLLDALERLDALENGGPKSKPAKGQPRPAATMV